MSVFAWKPANMPGVPRNLIEHSLNIDGKLWRKNAKEEILMKCITQKDGEHLLDKIHSGSCGNHVASRTLVGKAF